MGEAGMGEMEEVEVESELMVIGNVGILTGPPFFASIAAYMNGTGRLAIQGVDYPANIAGFLAGGSTTGATTMYFPPPLSPY
jgi:hypothetical protein